MRSSGRFLALLANLMFVTSLSFGSAIVSGFNSTTDGPNNSGTYTAPDGCTNPYPGGTCAGTPVPLGFNVDFFGVTYNSVYINTDGALSFDAPLPYASGILDSGGLINAYDDIVAPFLADVDTRGTGTVSFGTGTFDGDPAFGVTWDAVGYFDDETDKTDTFQALLVDEGAGNFEIVFNYGDIEWETGDADYGVDGLGGYSAIAGFVNGTSYAPTAYQLPGSGVPGSFINGGPNALISNSLNSNIPGQYIFNFVDGSPVSTPEPGTLSLTTFAFLLVVFFARRRLRIATTHKRV